MPAHPTPGLEEIYDLGTLRAIESWRGDRRPAEPPAGGWRARLTGGALLAAVALGLQEALEPPRPAEIVEVDPWVRVAPDQWVRLLWSADPRRTIALAFPGGATPLPSAGAQSREVGPRGVGRVTGWPAST